MQDAQPLTRLPRPSLPQLGRDALRFRGDILLQRAVLEVLHREAASLWVPRDDLRDAGMQSDNILDTGFSRHVLTARLGEAQVQIR